MQTAAICQTLENMYVYKLDPLKCCENAQTLASRCQICEELWLTAEHVFETEWNPINWERANNYTKSNSTPELDTCMSVPWLFSLREPEIIFRNVAKC